ncbi:hypothetical protein P7K49_039821 [Saguinus oedipus]|uniref:Uncharacterized protein n=1 Tax=Saguinus oedipus TaxID=9490 RepID=A0ABQ9TCA8_SAGOE|nr:hypothetical protein P7K49_039821 [Saguinus oedipus]
MYVGVQVGRWSWREAVSSRGGLGHSPISENTTNWSTQGTRKASLEPLTRMKAVRDPLEMAETSLKMQPM